MTEAVPRSPRKAIWHRLVPLCGVALLGVVVWRVGVGNIMRAATGLRYAALAPLPFLIAAMFAVQTLKWRLLLRRPGLHVRFSILLRLNMLGTFYGTVTPGRLGTLLKVRYLAEHCRRPVSELVSSVVLDKLIELGVLAVCAAAGAVLVAERLGGLAVTVMVALACAMAAGALLLCHRGVLRFILRRLLFAVAPRSRHETLGDRIDALHATMPGFASLAAATVLSLAAWLLIWTQAYTVSQALGMDIAYGLFVCLVPVSSLAALLPVTINGIGVREVTLVPLLASFGVPPEKSVAMTLATLILCVFVPALLGITQTRYFARAASADGGDAAERG